MALLGLGDLASEPVSVIMKFVYQFLFLKCTSLLKAPSRVAGNAPGL
jgi:hypothetical protein